MLLFIILYSSCICNNVTVVQEIIIMYILYQLSQLLNTYSRQRHKLKRAHTLFVNMIGNIYYIATNHVIMDIIVHKNIKYEATFYTSDTCKLIKDVQMPHFCDCITIYTHINLVIVILFFVMYKVYSFNHLNMQRLARHNK